MSTTRNTAWIVTAHAPLLRPGMTISITVSEKYVVEEALKLIEKVRLINVATQPVGEDVALRIVKEATSD